MVAVEIFKKVNVKCCYDSSKDISVGIGKWKEDCGKDGVEGGGRRERNKELFY